MRVAGVDGTKGGWVAILLDDGRFVDDYLIQPVKSTFEELAVVEVIGIDIPIGFGPNRTADKAARAFLRGAASTVFSTASREQLEAKFGPGLGLSAQSHALGERIIHVTDLAAADPRIHEVHPEVSFRAMNDGQPLRQRKKSADGALQRLELLRRHGIELARLEQAAAVPLDDVLDAAATAWSAHRIATGTAQTLPDPAELVDGRRVAIWF
jgi:predicted RNase H-like nuclease